MLAKNILGGLLKGGFFEGGGLLEDLRTIYSGSSETVHRINSSKSC